MGDVPGPTRLADATCPQQSAPFAPKHTVFSTRSPWPHRHSEEEASRRLRPPSPPGIYCGVSPIFGPHSCCLVLTRTCASSQRPIRRKDRSVTPLGSGCVSLTWRFWLRSDFAVLGHRPLWSSLARWRTSASRPLLLLPPAGPAQWDVPSFRGVGVHTHPRTASSAHPLGLGTAFGTGVLGG